MSPSPSSRSRAPTLRVDAFLRLMVLRRILLLNDGRDKVLKVLQYSAKAVLYLGLLERILPRFAPLLLPRPSARSSKALLRQEGNDLTTSSATGAPLPTPAAAAAATAADLRARLDRLISHMSLSRKVVRLFHVLEPLQALRDLLYAAPRGAPLLLPLLSATVGLANDVSDDLVCWSKLGVLPPEVARTFTPWSDRLWFASIFIDARDLALDRAETLAKLRAARAALATAGAVTKGKAPPAAEAAEVEALRARVAGLQARVRLQRISGLKLTADLIFCTADVF
ncbi:hypothetical protein HK405_015859, partial [Cladochytrium tenue]